MMTTDRSTASQVSASQIYRILPEIAHQVAAYWETTHHRACSNPCVLLGEDRLTITLEDALTSLEATHAATDDGYRVVLATVQSEIDGIYPQLASQVERHFHCYAGALHVAIIAARAAIRVELELREPPAYLVGAAFASQCP